MFWGYVWNGCINSHFLDLIISCIWMVSFMPWSLGQTAPTSRRIGSCAGPRASLADVERIKIMPLLGLEYLALSHPTHSQSLYQLHYPTSHHLHSMPRYGYHRENQENPIYFVILFGIPCTMLSFLHTVQTWLICKPFCTNVERN
jgi:hypothetical protein